MTPEDEDKDRRNSGWTFAQAAEAALKHLSEHHQIVRIVGPSGFGKSRFAYELFNRQKVVADQIDAAAIIYADFPIVGDEVAKLALEVANSASPVILVVDDCPDNIHSRLANIAQCAGSELRLVTVDVETRIPGANDTLIINLEPAPDELIGNIAKSVSPMLSDVDSQFIQELANGFPRMAVLAAQRAGRRREAIVSIGQVLDRIIWGNRPHNERAQKAVETLSLFEWLGLSGRVKEQVAFAARELGGMPEDTFVEDLKSIKPRGIIVQRGDFVQVQPIPLAARLATDRLSLLPDGKLASLFAEAPSELRISILRRFRWLDTSPEAKIFAKQLLHENCLGNLAALNSGFGSEAVDHLVHIEPDAVMSTIDRLFGKLPLEQLYDIKEGRRHIVWALEKLAFRKKTFERAATLLRRLGAAETEEQIGNNACGQFKQLYQLYLSGTQASPEERLRVLDEGLRSDGRNERDLCIDALGQMLQTGHFTHVGGGDEIGSERLEDWAPKTYGEIWDFHRAAMNRLAEIGSGDDEFADRARGLLSSHIRGLLSAVPVEDVKAMVERIVDHVGIWIDAIQGVNSWLYFDRKHAPKDVVTKVRAFFDQLMPAQAVDLVVLYTHGWQGDFYDPEADFDSDGGEGQDHEYAVREACRFAVTIAGDETMLDNALHRLVTSSAKTIYPFSRRLAELASDPVGLFTKALRIAEPRTEPTNIQFFRGLIAGTDQRDPRKARDCIRAALESPKLRNDAVSMIGSSEIQPGDLRVVVSLLQSGDVEPWQCATLSYGRGLDHLSPEQIMPFLDELGQHGARGNWAVIEIISMYLYGGRQLPEPFADKLKSTLLIRNLLDGVSRHTRDGYLLEQATKLFLHYGKSDRKFVVALVKQLLSIFARQKSEAFYALKGSVRSIITSLIASYPNQVWHEVSAALISRDSFMRLYVDNLFEPPHDNHLGPGILYGLPPALYLDWVRKAPSARAETIMKWLPIVTTRSDGTRTWGPELESYVDEFGDQPRVLVGLARRLHPKSWWGSVALHLEPFLPLLEIWIQHHPRSEVRRWASDRTDYINAEIEASRRDGGA